ncbi:MAG: DUF309 domain-containing protein [Ignavibacteria bacterium]
MYDIKKGISLFNDSKFFEAHDFFEEIWIDTDNDDRLFYQGLIQISVGCFHLISGNYKGALSQYNKGYAKLSKYPEIYYGVNIQKLLYNVGNLIFDLNRLYNREISEIDLNKIPVIEFKQL